VPEAAFLFAAVALSLILYSPALNVFFSTDDLHFLERAAGYEDWNKGLRRWISVQFFFNAGWRVFGDDPRLYHLFILALHGLNAWLVSRVGRALGLGLTGARLAGFLFLVSPAAFTCLHWISGVQDVSVTSFTLLCALFLLRHRPGWDLAAFLCYLAAVLCKESAFLALPALALVLPLARRRRLILVGASLAAGIPILYLVGAFVQRAPTDPYATVYGSNILWNLLTYLAWLVRPWVFFPDQVPQYSLELRPWGLVLPAVLALLAWRRRDWAPAIGRAALLFLVLVLPVLPLIRHTYYYYLYLPLVPLWLLAGAGLERLAAKAGPPRVLAYALPLVAMAVTLWQGQAHRGAMLTQQLPQDPFLRYGLLARNAVVDLRAAATEPEGDILIIAPFMGESVDLAKGLRRAPGMRRTQFLPLNKAFYGGKTLRVFFPELDSAQIVMGAGEDLAWAGLRVYWTHGEGHIVYLGEGETARAELVNLFAKYGKWADAGRTLDLIMRDAPTDPRLFYDRALIAYKAGDAETLRRAEAALRGLAEAPDPSPRAQELHAALLELIAAAGD
jgi:hypothetical protein